MHDLILYWCSQTDEEAELDPTKYYETRSRHIAAMKANKEDPYPHKFHVSIGIQNFIDKVQLKNSNTML